jgi:hypothetical protein
LVLFCIFSWFCFVFLVVFVLGVDKVQSIATADAIVAAFVAVTAAARRTIAEAIIWSERAAVRFRELFEREHAFVQSTQLAANLCDNRLNERRNRISQALYHAQ